jgi:GDP-L-fucose synthase
VNELDSMASWPSVMNVGAGADHTIREYYEIACEIVGFPGELAFDTSKPSGVARRLINSDVARSHAWKPTTTIREGMRASYEAFAARTTNGD